MAPMRTQVGVLASDYSSYLTERSDFGLEPASIKRVAIRRSRVQPDLGDDPRDAGIT